MVTDAIVEIVPDPDDPGGVRLVLGDLTSPGPLIATCANYLAYHQALGVPGDVWPQVTVPLDDCTLDETDDYIRSSVSTVVADARDRATRLPPAPWG